MNLFELKEEIEDTQSDIDYFKEEKKRLETYTTDEVVKELDKTNMYLNSAIKKLNNLKVLENKKYIAFQKANNYDKQIYIEKKLKKWSDSKISARHNGISRTQIYKIIKKVEKLVNKS